MKIRVDISCGELVDKLSILEIKKQNISEEQKLFEINKEFRILNEIPISLLNYVISSKKKSNECTFFSLVILSNPLCWQCFHCLVNQIAFQLAVEFEAI